MGRVQSTPQDDKIPPIADWLDRPVPQVIGMAHPTDRDDLHDDPVGRIARSRFAEVDPLDAVTWPEESARKAAEWREQMEYRLREVEAWMEDQNARAGWTDTDDDYGLAAASGTDQLDEDPAEILKRSTSTRRPK